ncbi:MAG: PAS domain S-box protein [Elusimicrobia bacterium]|nr:PAS domain S-box protein [Elusimicrobiota bacterium]
MAAKKRAPAGAAARARCEPGRRFQDFVEGCPDIFWETDAAGRYVYLSPNVKAVLGFDAAEMLGRPVVAFMPPDEGERVGGLFSGYAASRSGFSLLEHDALTKEGAVRRLECSGRPLLDAGGRLTGYRGIDRDVTEREAALRAAQENKALADALFAALPDLVFKVDGNGVYRYAHAPAGFRFAMPPEDFIGRSIADVMPPDISTSCMKALRKTIGSGRVVFYEYELPVPFPDGPKSRFEARIIPQGPESAIIVVRDLTALALEKRRLAESEARYRTLADDSADAVFLFDDQGRIRDVNKTAATLLGYAREEFLAMAVPDLEARAPREKMLAAWAAMRPGESRTFDGLCRRKGHAPFEVESRVACFTEGGKRLFLGSVRDVTDRREAAQKLRLKDEQVRQAQRMESVGRLAGGIAHEFNNILAGVGGLAQLMKESLGPGRPESEDAQEIIDSCARAAGLVAQLLTFSRSRAPHRAPVDAGVLFDRLTKVLRPAIDMRIAFETSVDAGTPPMLADISQIEQALVNLCLNSADAIGGKGTIRVSAEAVTLDAPRESRLGTLAPGRWVRLRVADDGSGIAPEHQGRVFEPFFTTKPVGQGTGLGLSVVFGIVSHHGGLVDLRSEGRGTTVDLFLPVASDAVIERVGPAAPSGQSRRLRGSETLLVAEDDRALRSVVARSLEGFGYKVIAAADGAEALRLFKERGAEVSLALLDIMMPNLEGYEAYEAMAPLKPGMKVLFMSGHSDAGSRPVGLGLPFVQKPFSPETLAARVREVLDG